MISDNHLDKWRVPYHNLCTVRASAVVLVLAFLFGVGEFLLWGRSHWEDGVLLTVLLLLASYDRFNAALDHSPTLRSHVTGWGMLVVAGVLMTFISRTVIGDSFHDLTKALCKNGALLLIALAITMHYDGSKTALAFFPLYLLAIVILPLYEYLLLEISYPLRLISTAAASYLLRICTVPVSYDATTLYWNDQAISITDACSGIALLCFLFLLEYLIARRIQAPAWCKWCWSSMVLIWIILANALRQLLTFVLFTFMGEKVHERTPHFLLG